MDPTMHPLNGTAPAQVPDIGGESDWPALDDEAGTRAHQGSVRIARRVLRTVVEQAALGVPGVAGLAHRAGNLGAGWRGGLPGGFAGALGRPLPHHGLALAVHGDALHVDLFLVAQPDASLVAIGTGVQEAVAAAIEHILGMHAAEVNVYIQDVA